MDLNWEKSSESEGAMMKRILIVDDAKDIVFLFKSRLEANGFDVVTAHDGREGISKAIETTPDLILLDIQMPDLDGYTFLHNIRKLLPLRSVPIIVATSNPEMEPLFRAEGIADFLEKPTESKTLISTVRKCLAER